MKTAEQTYIDDLIISALTVESDEVEGLQTIDLDNLNLCAVDYANTDTVDIDASLTEEQILKDLYQNDNIMKLLSATPEELADVIKDISLNDKVILEFADANVQDPNPVTYTINVKPGDQITDDTIIGQVVQMDKMKDIKSIFQRATVKGINNNSDYFRLYPSKCNRHIVLEDAFLTDGNDFDLHIDIKAICDKFTDEAMLYALITNNLLLSLLPYVLSHRYRGTYTRTQTWGGTFWRYGKWSLSSNDTSVGNLDISTFVEDKDFENNQKYDTSLYIFDIENNNKPNGIQIFNSSILNVLYDSQDEFASKMVSEDLNKQRMKDWRKRAKKKKKRKKVRQEINEVAENSVGKLKNSKTPVSDINKEGLRLISERNKYMDTILGIYKNREQLPLCKYDPDYADCQFLTNDTIDKEVLSEVRSDDSDFSYNAVGDDDSYYNYYTSLLANINLSSDNEYVKEYYDIITDIINKRLIIEKKSYIEMMQNFMDLFNNNVSKIFNDTQAYAYASTFFSKIGGSKIETNDLAVVAEFNKFEGYVNNYVKKAELDRQSTLREQFSQLDDPDTALENAGTMYSSDSEYKKIYDYINSMFQSAHSNDEDYNEGDEIVALLATLYTYIKSYGDGSKNPYVDIDTSSKYLYFELVIEEAKKITDFWDKIINIYENSNLTNCIEELEGLAHSFDQYAEWPTPTDITIGDTIYHHYLFENIYDNTVDVDNEVEIGDYSFPESVDIPDIPDDVSIPFDEVINDLENHNMAEIEKLPNISFKDFKYWQKYFALATLICLVPCFWNCGLDIIPFIQLIPLPCIFICITSVNIPLFNLVIVFGIAIRGMYPFPIILYLNTSDQPISVLTPLIAVLDLLKNAMFDQINNIEQVSIQSLVNIYIKKLNTEINDLEKENKKLTNFQTVCKNMKFPKAASIQKQFAEIVDPSIDFRQRLTRIDQLAKKSRV